MLKLHGLPQHSHLDRCGVDFGEGVAERLGSSLLTMNEPDALFVSGRRLEIVQQFTVICVTTERVEYLNSRVELVRFAEDRHLFPFVTDLPSQRVLRAIANEQDRVALIFDVVLQMMQHPARLTHP